jgi:hypothetical protein
MTRAGGRTQTCGIREAQQRMEHARRYLEVAEMTADSSDSDLEYGPVAASIAILAGIAAADAACCAALGRRSRSDNHRDAAELLSQIAPDGKNAGQAMRRLIGLKDSAHYGFLSLGAGELKHAMRQAGDLVDFAEQVLLRSR